MTFPQFNALVSKAHALTAIGKEPYVRMAHHVMYDRTTRAVKLGQEIADILVAVGDAKEVLREEVPVAPPVEPDENPDSEPAEGEPTDADDKE